ncbi:class I SAM-dependent methyltransferase [Anaerolineales bacterium]
MTEFEKHELNRLSWNAATVAHNRHKGDQAAFFKNGGNSLFPEEMRLLGDIRQQTLLHLQCNAGQDSLSIAKHLGAKVTGVDISDEAIQFAQDLAKESEIEARFIRDDIYHFFLKNSEEFDLVFASYGAIPWLSNIKEWGKGIANCLKAGGKMVLVESHPMTMALDEQWQIRYDCMGGTATLWEEGIGDYVAASGNQLNLDGETQAEVFKNPHPVYEYAWSLSDVMMALIQAGLSIEQFEEYDYSNGWKPFPDLIEADHRQNHLPEGKARIPLMYGLVARK